LLEGKPVVGILGTALPPNKEHPVKKIEEIKVKDYDILVLPGGVKAMEKVRQNLDIIKFISDFNAQNKIIACICSGAQLLISAKIVKGRKIAGYYSMKDDLINAGAVYTDLPAVVDKNIVTTAHYKDMGPWMKAVIKNLK
jgi:protease I